MARANNTHAHTRTFLFVYCWIPYTAFFRSSNSLADGFFSSARSSHFVVVLARACVCALLVSIHRSANPFLVSLVSGKTAIGAMALALLSSFGFFGVCFPYCVRFTFVLCDDFHSFLRALGHFLHCATDKVKITRFPASHRGGLRLSSTPEPRYVPQLGTRIYMWAVGGKVPNSEYNACKYERWENKFYTHIKLFLLKVLSLLWIQHIKWYLLVLVRSFVSVHIDE